LAQIQWVEQLEAVMQVGERRETPWIVYCAFAVRTKMRAMLQRGSDKTLMFVESEVLAGFRPCRCRHDTCTPTHS
jgi:hypothetical protein